MTQERHIRREIAKTLAAIPATRAFCMTGVAEIGVPDFVVCHGGVFVGLEIKTATGAIRPIQVRVGQQITRAGGYWFVVRSREDVLKALALVRGEVDRRKGRIHDEKDERR